MNCQFKFVHHALYFLLLSLLGVTNSSAATINSVLNDSTGTSPKIIVLGTDLLGVSFKLAGIDIPASCIDNVSDTEQHIGYCSESALAVPEQGSYKLFINETIQFDIYFDQAIIPPSGSNNCPCVAGVSTIGSGKWTQPPIPNDNSTFCYWYENPDGGPYTEQVWITGIFTDASSNYTVSALWDPEFPSYDPSNPDNSSSICALHNDSTGTYDVAHPVASDQQFKSCFDWLLRSGGPCL
jgi:hypothetical protein